MYVIQFNKGYENFDVTLSYLIYLLLQFFLVCTLNRKKFLVASTWFQMKEFEIFLNTGCCST